MVANLPIRQLALGWVPTGITRRDHLGIELQVNGEVVQGRRRRPFIDQLSHEGSAFHHRHLAESQERGMLEPGSTYIWLQV